MEFNARFGDPETQALLPLVAEDLVEVLWDAVSQRLHGRKKRWIKLLPKTSVHVVLAAEGYPGAVSTGDVISLPSTGENEWIFFAGVAPQGHQLVTNGGRVLGVTALGDDRNSARNQAYQLAQQIHFRGMQCRGDIAQA